MKIKLDEEIKDEDKPFLQSLLEDNLKLIHTGLKLLQITQLHLQKIDQQNFADTLFTTELVSISLNPHNNVPVFQLSNELFLSPRDSSYITIWCTGGIAYALGNKPQQKSLIFGPLSYNTVKDRKRNTEERIMASGASLGGALRPYPKLVRLCSDVISHSEIRDFWISEMGSAENSDLYQFHVIYSHLIDQAAVDNRFLCKPDEVKSPHRMVRSSNILNSIRLKLIDEHAKVLYFPKSTVCRVGLTMSPYRSPEDD